MLLIAATHPVQYHAPVYRLLAQQYRVPVHVLYGSDFSLHGYRDVEFANSFAWDSDLSSGYAHEFVRAVADGGAADYQSLTGVGVADAIARLQPTAVMVQGYAHPFDRAAIAAALALGRPLLVRSEANDAARSRSWWRAQLRDVWLRRLYRRCAGALYIGSRAKAHYQRLGLDNARLWFSPYGVDAGPFATEPAAALALRQTERSERGWTEQDVVLLCSGKLIAKKGQDLILSAVAGLSAADRDRVVVALLGSGPDEAALRAQLERCPGVRTHFYGFRNQHSLSPVYCAADISVQPSREGETWGLVVNEAMLHGLPVIASDLVGSATDLIVPDQTGQICRHDDVESLRGAISKELRRLPTHQASASRAQVARYSLNAAAQGIATAWATVQR